MTLSIIIPVYNVEKYIRPCLESVFRQGLDDNDFEVIVVNDGTPDHSMEIVASFAELHHNVNIVEQSNQGLSAARNTGLDNAKGDYIFFLDSDDILIPDTLPLLLKEAESHNTDMAVADFVKMDDDAIEATQLSTLNTQHSTLNAQLSTLNTQHSTPSAQCPTPKILSGTEMFLGKLFNPRACYVWHTLYKHTFLLQNGLRFIPGIYFEDVPFTTNCYLKADRCLFTKLPIYIYRQRKDSIVSSINMRKVTDMNTVIAHLWQMKSDLCTTPELRQRMDETIFATFSIASWYVANDKKLLDDRHTFVADLRSKVPQLTFSGGVKQRLTSAFFKLMPETYLWLRSKKP